MKISRVRDTITNIYGLAIWEICRVVARDLGTSSPPAMWNKIMRSLGYAGVTDKTGQGIIHPNEPTQAVFFSKQAIRVVEMIHNVRRKKAKDYNYYPIKIKTIDELLDIIHYHGHEDDFYESSRNENPSEYLYKEWTTLLLTGKSEHFVIVGNDFEKSLFSPSFGGYRFDHFISAVLYHSSGSITSTFKVLDHLKVPDDVREKCVQEMVRLIDSAKLSREDISTLVSQPLLKIFSEYGFYAHDIAISIISGILKPIKHRGYVKKAIKGVPKVKDRNGNRYPEHVPEIWISVDDIMSKIGPSAKAIMRLVSREDINRMIRKSYQDNYPF